MKKNLFACVLLAVLTACGGAGTSLTPRPISAPKTHQVGFTLTALGPGRTGAAVRVMTAGACTATPATLTLQAVPPTAPPSGYEWDATAGYQIVATEHDAN